MIFILFYYAAGAVLSVPLGLAYLVVLIKRGRKRSDELESQEKSSNAGAKEISIDLEAYNAHPIHPLGPIVPLRP